MSLISKAGGIAVLALLLVAGTSLAQGPVGWGPTAEAPHGGGFEMGPGPGGAGQGEHGGFGMEQLAGFRMLFRNLDLSDSQIEEIQSIVEAAREEARGIMEAAGGVEDHTPFIELFTSPTLTVADLEENAGRMNEVREEVQAVVFQAIVDVHNVLTTQQLQELAEMVEEHGFGMGQGPGNGPGMRPMN